jgi:hypothetical protein
MSSGENTKREPADKARHIKHGEQTGSTIEQTNKQTNLNSELAAVRAKLLLHARCTFQKLSFFTIKLLQNQLRTISHISSP